MIETIIMYSAAIVLTLSIFFVITFTFFIYAVENDLLEEERKQWNLNLGLVLSKEEQIRRLNISTNTFFVLLLASAITLYVVE